MKSFSGHHLKGKKLLRLTYVDEAVTSAREPYAIVVGVIVHGDQQLTKVEENLNQVCCDYIPEQDRNGFVFHSTDIFSGVRYYSDREDWPIAKRYSLLSDILRVLDRNKLPVAWGCAKKEYIKKYLTPGAKVEDMERVFYMSAYSSALHSIEKYFRQVYPEENTIVVAEDRQKTRQHVKALHASLQGRGERLPQVLLDEYRELPFEHIKDTVHFATKSESILLQMADACAFVLRGFASQHPKNGPFFDIVKPALILPPKNHDEMVSVEQQSA